MTVSELIAMLSEFDGHEEVRFLGQPSWPFEYSISKVIQRQDIVTPDDEEPFDHDENNQPDTVLLVEGSQLCYGEKAGFDC